MILTKLKEAKVKDTDIQLVRELKENSAFAPLRDKSVINIIRVFKKNSDEKPTSENIIKFFNESGGTFGNFFFDYFDDLSTYTVSDFAEHEEKLRDAIKQACRDLNIIDAEGNDTSFDSEHKNIKKKLTLLDMCSILLDYRSEKRKPDEDPEALDPNEVVGYFVKDTVDDDGIERKAGDALYRTPAKQLKGKVEFDRNKYINTIDTLDDIYNAAVTESTHVCEKCGKSPCICEAEEEHIEEPESIAEISEEPVEAPAVEEPHADVPESVFTDLINSAIQKEWDFISSINSLIATFEFEYKDDNKEDLASIFNQLVDDTTINIGMLHKAAELVSSKQAELMDAGEQKAEEIISEPAQELANENLNEASLYPSEKIKKARDEIKKLAKEYKLEFHALGKVEGPSTGDPCYGFELKLPKGWYAFMIEPNGIIDDDNELGEPEPFGDYWDTAEQLFKDISKELN